MKMAIVKTNTKLSILKGVAHSILIPYTLLWFFQNLGVWALIICLVYLFFAGLIYISPGKKYTLASNVFFGTLEIVGIVVLTIIAIALVSIASS